jgi:hypothetical protein
MSKPHNPELNRDASILVNLRHVPCAELSSVNGRRPRIDKIVSFIIIRCWQN